VPSAFRVHGKIDTANNIALRGSGTAYTICPKCHFEEPSTTACSRCGTVFATWYAMHTTQPAAEPPAVAEALRKFEELRAVEMARRRQAIVVRNVILVAGFLLLIAFTLCHR
jgi:hypothetical protein